MDDSTLQTLAGDHEAAVQAFREANEKLDGLRDALVETEHRLALIKAGFIAPQEDPTTGETPNYLTGSNETKRDAQLVQLLDAHRDWQYHAEAKHGIQRDIRRAEVERDIARSNMSLTRALIRAGVTHDD